MTTEEKIAILYNDAQDNINKFSSYELSFLEGVQYLSEFSAKQNEKVDEVYRKYIREYRAIRN